MPTNKYESNSINQGIVLMYKWILTQSVEDVRALQSRGILDGLTRKKNIVGRRLLDDCYDNACVDKLIHFFSTDFFLELCDLCAVNPDLAVKNLSVNDPDYKPFNGATR